MPLYALKRQPMSVRTATRVDVFVGRSRNGVPRVIAFREESDAVKASHAMMLTGSGCDQALETVDLDPVTIVNMTARDIAKEVDAATIGIDVCSFDTQDRVHVMRSLIMRRPEKRRYAAHMREKLEAIYQRSSP